MADAVEHALMANAIRVLAMDAVQAANSGHPGLPMGAADIATVLFTKHLKFDAADPHWPDRDRFVLSAGHGSMLLYSLLHLLGYEGMTIDELKHFRQLGSKTAGHPEYGHAAGIETTTGPLGQGLANAVGMAIAERHDECAVRRRARRPPHLRARLRRRPDGGDQPGGDRARRASEARTGSSSSSTTTASPSTAPIALSDSTDQVKRFEASGWRAMRIDGHDPDAIDAALAEARTSDRPALIAAQDDRSARARRRRPAPPPRTARRSAPEEIAGARARFGWTHEPFELPEDVVDAWRAGRRAARAPRARPGRSGSHAADAATRGGIRAPHRRRDRAGPRRRRSTELKRGYAEKPAKVATRKASELALDAINAALPETIGGSADLTPSNNTKSKGLEDVAPGNFGGRYIHYGIREHGMAAAMNGMALHGGLIPYGGTFLIFSDYCRPAIRLSALMGQRVIYVMTHDSIGLGEDGPTHQPVEHLAALRAMPNLRVYRPADAVETAECWQLALHDRDAPEPDRADPPEPRAGAARLRRRRTSARAAPMRWPPPTARPRSSLFATGSEVGIAIEAQEAARRSAASPRASFRCPCFERFVEQDAAYRAATIGTAPVRVGIEAAVRQGWDAIIGDDGIFVGMTASARAGPTKTSTGISASPPRPSSTQVTARIGPERRNAQRHSDGANMRRRG